MVRASASRLDKGLLAVPQKFRDWFPSEKRQIPVVFDDEDAVKVLTYHPSDPTTKESRIFGLHPWYSEREVRQGDLISITLEDTDPPLYRIALDRYVRKRQEGLARQRLIGADADSEAEQQLSILKQLTRKRPRELAQEMLLRIAQESARDLRPSVTPTGGERRGGVPAGIRVMLRELHEGKCQICSFTFEKRSGEPYFEIHHLDPLIGHHPTNLLLVCPNCHAQLEHATIDDFRWAGHWLVGLSINGKRVSVRQPLAHDSLRRAFLSLFVAIAAIRFGRTVR